MSSAHEVLGALTDIKSKFLMHPDINENEQKSAASLVKKV